MSGPRRLHEALRDAEATLLAAGVASPRTDARLLAAHLLGCSPMDLHFRRDDAEPAGFSDLVACRARRVPLQHLLGRAPFGPLELEVGPGVFVPRPETEVLGQWAVDMLLHHRDQPGRAVDLCTGSGALAAWMASATQAQIAAVEISEQAVRYARRNLPHWVTLLHADATGPDLLHQAPLKAWVGICDVVVSNPPYVPSDAQVPPEVHHDPPEAVFAGADGMALIPALAAQAHALLRPGGVVGFEHDDATSEATQRALRDAGFVDVRPLQDLAGRNRFALARKASE